MRLSWAVTMSFGTKVNKITLALVPANMFFFMWTNPMLVMLKKFKLSLKRLKIKRLRKTKKH
jgi:hypothetical protein